MPSEVSSSSLPRLMEADPLEFSEASVLPKFGAEVTLAGHVDAVEEVRFCGENIGLEFSMAEASAFQLFQDGAVAPAAVDVAQGLGVAVEDGVGIICGLTTKPGVDVEVEVTAEVALHILCYQEK